MKWALWDATDQGKGYSACGYDIAVHFSQTRDLQCRSPKLPYLTLPGLGVCGFDSLSIESCTSDLEPELDRNPTRYASSSAPLV